MRNILWARIDIVWAVLSYWSDSGTGQADWGNVNWLYLHTTHYSCFSWVGGRQHTHGGNTVRHNLAVKKFRMKEVSRAEMRRNMKLIQTHLWWRREFLCFGLDLGSQGQREHRLELWMVIIILRHWLCGEQTYRHTQQHNHIHIHFYQDKPDWLLPRPRDDRNCSSASWNSLIPVELHRQLSKRPVMLTPGWAITRELL